MHQQWLTVLGLGLDFIGFCLLLREWWLAFFHESSEIVAAERRASQLSFRAFTQKHMQDAHRAHSETAARMEDERHARQEQERARTTLAKRKRMFVAATVLIITGFALQLIGAAPGCCPPWIVPQG